MDSQEIFNEIIHEFRDKINDFLRSHDFDEYSIIVQLKNDTSKTPITTMRGEVIENNAFFHDTDFKLCQDASVSS